EWIAMRRAMPRIEQWIYYLASAVFAGIAVFSEKIANGVAFSSLGLGSILLLIRLASQASYPLCDARRSGAIEMVLSTSLNPWLLIRGQITALRRQFTIPFGILCAGSVMLVFGTDEFGLIFAVGFYNLLIGGA